MTERRAQVLVLGGGVGGVAAALAAAGRGLDVVLTEGTDWLGGVLTSQAVPPDEHSWIEQFGCTASYRAVRDGVRAYYRAHYPLTPAARARRILNAGADRVTVAADWFVDATETGDLLPLCGAEYVTGAESRKETGEPHAPAAAQPLNMQPISVCYALDHFDGEDHTVERPADYLRFRQAPAVDWPEGQLSFVAPDPKTREPVRRTLRPNPDGDPGRI